MDRRSVQGISLGLPLWREGLLTCRMYIVLLNDQLFNTVAVLIGVGLLSESLAFYYAGWVMGTVLLVYFALLTNYT